MKNRNFLFVLALIFPVAFSSCEDYLAEPVKDKISTDYIYSSPAGLEVGVNALYNRMRQYNLPAGDNTDLWANVFFMACTDLGLHRTWNTPYSTNHTPAAFTGSKWTNGYRIIDRCSAVITAARSINMDATAKKKLVAQARAIRGEVYMDLKEQYNTILIDTIPTTPENLNDPVEYKAASDADVWKLINDDLDYAVANLDYKVLPGRYGQGVARHIRGKAAMWQKDYAQAAAQFEAIITEGTHNLVPLVDVFGQNGNHIESLLSYQKDFLLGASNELAGGGGSWLTGVFVQRLYEKQSGAVGAQFEVINDVNYGGQSLGWFFPNNYLKSLYDQAKDLRFKTYFYPDNYLEYAVNNPKHPRFGQPITKPEDNSRRFHWSLKKYHDLEKLIGTNDSYKDIVYYRFAETLLLASEAQHYLGNDVKALAYLNKVRRRGYTGTTANVASVNDITTWTLNTYLDESARELCFEHNRWFLLKRLGLLVERQNLYFRSSTSGTEAGQTHLDMKPHMVNMPIPQSQINLMGNPPGFNVGY